MYPPPTQFETRELRLAPERLRVVVGEDAGTVRLLEESGFDVVGQAGDPTTSCARSAPIAPTSP
jgi:hypothetical protein